MATGGQSQAVLIMSPLPRHSEYKWPHPTAVRIILGELIRLTIMMTMVLMYSTEGNINFNNHN
jgi:hypothetical protein